MGPELPRSYMSFCRSLSAAQKLWLFTRPNRGGEERGERDSRNEWHFCFVMSVSISLFFFLLQRAVPLPPILLLPPLFHLSSFSIVTHVERTITTRPLHKKGIRCKKRKRLCSILQECYTHHPGTHHFLCSNMHMGGWGM